MGDGCVSSSRRRCGPLLAWLRNTARHCGISMHGVNHYAHYALEPPAWSLHGAEDRTIRAGIIARALPEMRIGCARGRRRVPVLRERLVAYYHRSRTHLGLQKDTPEKRPIQAPGRRSDRRRVRSGWPAPSIRTSRPDRLVSATPQISRRASVRHDQRSRSRFPMRTIPRASATRD
jgi:hypothetical protein